MKRMHHHLHRRARRDAPRRAEPVVLAVDGKDIYVDLGANDGVGAGSELELLHEVVARDPQTGATLRDRFALGTLDRRQERRPRSASRAPTRRSRKRVLAGDHVRLVSAKRTFVDPWAEQVAASKGRAGAAAGPPRPAPRRAAPSITSRSLATRGKTRSASRSTQRIARWQALLAADPQTPYRKAIETEIASLDAQTDARDAALAKARSDGDRATRNPRIAQLAAQLAASLPTMRSQRAASSVRSQRAVPGRADRARVPRAPARRAFATAWLYVRPDGAPGFTRIELRRDGDAYLRGTIDGALVKGAKVEWYVEAGAAPRTNRRRCSARRSSRARSSSTRSSTEAPIEHGRTHIDGHVDYVDFDGGFGKGYDQYTRPSSTSRIASSSRSTRCASASAR